MEPLELELISRQQRSVNLEKNNSLESGLHAFLPHWGPCPPQALLPYPQEFPKPELANILLSPAARGQGGPDSPITKSTAIVLIYIADKSLLLLSSYFDGLVAFCACHISVKFLLPPFPRK